MRILHVITSSDPKAGGPIEGVRQRGQYLQKMGHEVEVLTAEAPDPEFAKAFPLPLHQCGPGKTGLAYAPGVHGWLLENGSRFDALVANGIWQYPNLALRSAALKLGRPYWVFPHGMLDPWFNKTFPLKKLKKMLFWPWQHAVLRDARAVLFTCEEEMLLARESFRPYQVRERVVKYGTAAPQGAPESQIAAFKSAVPELQGKRYIIFLSRIHPKKGVDLLIQAFAALAEKNPDLHLALAGPVDAEYRSQLDRLIAGKPGADRVRWLGMLQGDVKWGAFRCAEAFVLPSHQENFGIAVVEALACGIPVLITRPINIWREIEADGVGLVGEDTLEGVTDLLSRWTTLPSEGRERMAAGARTSFDNRFSVEKSAESLLEALQEGMK